MQKQTIDGVLVSRELLEWALRAASALKAEERIAQLRALLDAPACPSRLCHIDYTAHPYICGCLKGDAEAQRRFDEHQAKAAQPLGEPVAYLDENGKFVFIGHEKLRAACWVDASDRAIPDAWTPLHAKLTEPMAVINLGNKEVGCYGSLYDGPSVRRAYTYTHQPNNEAAYAIGQAAQATGIGGDCIDKGLKLLCELERAGYGVFKV